MITAPAKSKDDKLMRFVKQAQASSAKSVENATNIMCDGVINVTSAFIAYRSEYDDVAPCKPYLHIKGECESLEGEIPMLNKVTFGKGRELDIDLLYEFSDDELSALVYKGLYTKNFKVPQEIYDHKLSIPLTCDFTVVLPQTEADVPLVFANVTNSGALEINSETCGYVFGDYFPELTTQQKAAMRTPEQDFSVARDVSLLDFKDTEPEIEEKPAETIVSEQPAEEDKAILDTYERIMKRIKSEDKPEDKPVEKTPAPKADKPLEDIPTGSESLDSLRKIVDDTMDKRRVPAVAPSADDGEQLDM